MRIFLSSECELVDVWEGTIESVFSREGGLGREVLSGQAGNSGKV